MHKTDFSSIVYHISSIHVSSLGCDLLQFFRIVFSHSSSTSKVQMIVPKPLFPVIWAVTIYSASLPKQVSSLGLPVVVAQVPSLRAHRSNVSSWETNHLHERILKPAEKEDVKMEICHIPPSEPNSRHTITVTDKSLEAHLSHGDLVGSCAQNCEILCNDNNACTIDSCAEGSDQCTPVAEREIMDCDDNVACTRDSCDANFQSCVNQPDHTLCNDGELCSPRLGCVDCLQNSDCIDENYCTLDACVEGACIRTDKVCDDENACTVDSCVPGSGLCTHTPDNALCTDSSIPKCNLDLDCVQCLEHTDCGTYMLLKCSAVSRLYLNAPLLLFNR